jgi:hypothetical protein
MQISKDTMTKLKNFATINPNLVYDGNGKLKTISEAKNILASADVDIDKPLSIYDVNEFLSIVGLVENGDITINENDCVVTSGSKKVRYVFADSNILTAPQKDITMPPAEYSVSLTADDINNIIKAGSTLGHNTLRIEMTESQSGSIKVVDSTGASKNDYTLQDITSPTTAENVRFSFDILINNLKLIPGDYMVHLSSKLISKWEGKSANYFIALEGTSTFNT